MFMRTRTIFAHLEHYVEEPSLLRCYTMSTGKHYDRTGRTHCLHLQGFLLDPEKAGTTFVGNVGNFTDRQGVTSQKTLLFNTAVRISNLALYSPDGCSEPPNVANECTTLLRVQI